MARGGPESLSRAGAPRPSAEPPSRLLPSPPGRGRCWRREAPSPCRARPRSPSPGGGVRPGSPLHWVGSPHSGPPDPPAGGGAGPRAPRPGPDPHPLFFPRTPGCPELSGLTRPLLGPPRHPQGGLGAGGPLPCPANLGAGESGGSASPRGFPPSYPLPRIPPQSPRNCPAAPPFRTLSPDLASGEGAGATPSPCCIAPPPCLRAREGPG